MHPSLRFLSGDKAGRVLEILPERVYLFGREPGCDICVPEAKVSRKHAHLTWNPGSQQLILEDLKSTNGTMVNGEPLRQAIALKEGDRIQVGTVAMTIKIPQIELEETLTLRKGGFDEMDSEPFTSPSTDILPLDSLEEDSTPDALLDDLPSQPERNAKANPFEAGYETDGIALTGNLREMHLPDLLQMLAATRKTGKLVVASQKAHLSSKPDSDSAILWLNQGLLVAAYVQNFTGEKAFYELLKWTEGYFALYYKEPPPQVNQITQPLEILLLEGLRRLDEEKSLSVSLNPDDHLEVNSDAPLNLLEPDQLRIFQIAWKNKKVGQIWHASHLDLEETNDHLKRLLRGGYLKKT